MPDPSLLEALQSLRNAVAALPDLTPVAHQSAIVYRMFRDLPSGTTKDVCQQTVNAYKHCFVNPPSKRSPVDNIMRGTYGLDCVLRYLEKFIRLPGLSASCCAQIRQEIEQLTVLVYTRIQSVSGLGTRATPILPYPAQPKRVQLQPEAADDPESEINDQTYVQKNQTREDNLEEIWQDTNDENDSDGSAGMDPPVEITLNKEPTSTRIGAAGRGPDDPKRRWALANYEAPVPGRFENGTAAWVFNCKYCGHARRVPWTEGCQFIQHERLPIPSPNLTSHLYKCRNIPTACNWEAWTARKQAGATGIPHPNQLATQSLGALFEAMFRFLLPLLAYFQILRSALVQGVVHDTLPLTFGEGEVMRYVFKLVNPLVDLPSHQTMRRDLSELFKILSGRVSHVIQNQRARLAVTSDAWSSKSSIYSIAGVFITFIDKFWNLQDLVVDVVHLAADHRGTAMGQKIFNALRQKNATNNLIASITDNASNNETMNQEIAWQTQLKSTYKLHSQNMSVTCICHAIHLISSAILHSLGAIDTAALEDGYDIAKSFDCSERVEESQAVREEDARIQSGNIWKGDSHVPGELEDDLNNVDPDELELTSNDIAVPESEKLHAQKSQQRSRSLSLVQKVHAIAVHSTASPLRYKQMGEYIRLYCPEKLAVITSMPVRWGTALAELRRALILRPAFDHWVNTVDIRKQGFGKEKRQIAQALKRKLLMADDEWAVVEDLTIILAPLEAATLSFSKRGKANLPDVLLTYAHLHNGLQKSQTHLQKYGIAKLNKYFKIARDSDLILISSVLHPGRRLNYFRKDSPWAELMTRAQTLLEHLFDLYRLEEQSTRSDSTRIHPASIPKTPKCSWSVELLEMSTNEPDSTLRDEISRFFGFIDRYEAGTDTLKWWKEHEKEFPVLSRIARDYLGIPATSVSVERLFSQCKLVMSDYRNMSVETARQIITCQQWLRAGLGVNLPNFVSGNLDQELNTV